MTTIIQVLLVKIEFKFFWSVLFLMFCGVNLKQSLPSNFSFPNVIHVGFMLQCNKDISPQNSNSALILSRFQQN